MVNELEQTIREAVEEFLLNHENGVGERKVFVYAGEISVPVPNGKAVQVTIHTVSLAKLENRAE